MRIDIRQEWRSWNARTWLMEPKKGPWDKYPYRRFCRSKLGYFLHLLGYRIGWHTNLIFDPACGAGILGHIKQWLYNLWHVDIRSPITYRFDKWRRPEFHRQQQRLYAAEVQAIQEGYADQMPAPPGFPEGKFHGSILGKRYFDRVIELMKEDEPPK